jgi:phosphohistidine phosphatase SixA
VLRLGWNLGLFTKMVNSKVPMCNIFTLLVALFVALCSVWQVHAVELVEKLYSAQYVLLMRHALAPGVGDPPNYSLQNCATQRNLDAKGRQQAQATGNWLRAQGVKAADVYTSPWCRCKETAEQLQFQTPIVEPTLGSFFDEMHRGPQQTQALQKWIAAQLLNKTKDQQPKVLILVTHHVNIYGLVGENIGSGDMVLAQVNAQGKVIGYKLYPTPMP